MQTIFKGKGFGQVTVGERGQLVIPAELRKALNLKTGDKLMVFSKVDKRIISLMPAKDFAVFLEKASKAIEKLENKIK